MMRLQVERSEGDADGEVELFGARVDSIDARIRNVREFHPDSIVVV
jgi:hypothetical protein